MTPRDCLSFPGLIGYPQKTKRRPKLNLCWRHWTTYG